MRPTVFVSFSGRDTDVVGKLLFALRRYPLDVWDYTLAGTRIPLGDNIEEYCQKKIAEAMFFLAVITPNTISTEWGKYAQLETQYAIELKRTRADLTIVPVIDIAHPVQNLTFPYSELSGLLRIEIDGTSDASIENAVEAFCVERIGLDPVPTFRVDPRIRLIEHFREEYKEFHRKSDGNYRSDLPRSEYIRIAGLVEDFSKEVSKSPPDWAEALVIMQELIRIVRRHGLGNDLYFQLPMLGLCLFELGEYDRAKATFDLAVAHKKADINAYAGRALVEAKQGNRDSALRDLLKAEAQSAGVIPWEIKFNIACLLLESGASANLDQTLLQVDPELLEAEDWAKFNTLIGASLVQRGDYSGASRILQSVLARQALGKCVAHESTVVWYSQALTGMGETRRAAEELDRYGILMNSLELRYQAAYAYEELREVSKALAIFNELSRDSEPRTLRYLVGYMRLLKRAGMFEKSLEVARRILQIAEGRTAFSSEDHFYIGLCHFFLGNREIAEYERYLGRAFAKTPYEEL